MARNGIGPPEHSKYPGTGTIRLGDHLSKLSPPSSFNLLSRRSSWMAATTDSQSNICQFLYQRLSCGRYYARYRCTSEPTAEADSDCRVVARTLGEHKAGAHNQQLAFDPIVFGLLFRQPWMRSRFPASQVDAAIEDPMASATNPVADEVLAPIESEFMADGHCFVRADRDSQPKSRRDAEWS